MRVFGSGLSTQCVFLPRHCSGARRAPLAWLGQRLRADLELGLVLSSTYIYVYIYIHTHTQTHTRTNTHAHTCSFHLHLHRWEEVLKRASRLPLCLDGLFVASGLLL